VGLLNQLAERPGGGAADVAAAHAAAVAATAAAAAALAAVNADVATATAAVAATTAAAATAAAAVSTTAAAAAAADSAFSSSDLAAALATAVAALAAATADAVAARAIATAAAARSVATAAAAANGAGSSSDHAANGAGSSSEGADAAAFFELRRQLKAHLRDLTPVSSMNDRAPNGRAAARLVRGVGMGDEMPTCAEHAAVNIGEAGMKAVDAALRLAMNITDESAALDKEKIKGLATAIGWNSSPCNALSYAVAKYVALFSSKGYAIGENFAQWLEAQMGRDEKLEGDLREFVSDLQAICGSRNYVFFLNAAVVERFAQLDQLHGFLIEEKGLAAKAGGKPRGAILAGFNSAHIMAAVRTMAFICDAWMWPT